MIPFVRPAPLSACTLVGFRKANPHPSTMSCSVAGASLPGAGGGGTNPCGRAPGSGGRPSADSSVPGRNMIISGTRPFASSGTTTVSGMSTTIDVSPELSACPTSCFAITRRPPTRPVSVAVTVHVTFGTRAGTRPYTSRSNPSMISRRRCCHIRAFVTRRPSFIRSTSGSDVNGFASVES